METRKPSSFAGETQGKSERKVEKRPLCLNTVLYPPRRTGGNLHRITVNHRVYFLKPRMVFYGSQSITYCEI
jgi:hypothetical protein